MRESPPSRAVTTCASQILSKRVFVAILLGKPLWARISTDNLGGRLVLAKQTVQCETPSSADDNGQGHGGKRQGIFKTLVTQEETVLPMHRGDGARHDDEDTGGRQAREAADDQA